MKESFERFVQEQTACDMDKLDRAVMNGITRAKSKKIDKKKVFRMVLATAATLFLTTGLGANERLQKSMYDYYVDNSIVGEESSRALQDYIQNGSKFVVNYLR